MEVVHVTPVVELQFFDVMGMLFVQQNNNKTKRLYSNFYSLLL